MEAGLKRKPMAHQSYSCKKIKRTNRTQTQNTEKVKPLARKSVSCNPKPKIKINPAQYRSLSARLPKTVKNQGDNKAGNKENFSQQFTFFKARPAPNRKSPFKPKISTKKLTVPIEPLLHTDIRAQQRTNQGKAI